jgi:hypothetical protein
MSENGHSPHASRKRGLLESWCPVLKLRLIRTYQDHAFRNRPSSTAWPVYRRIAAAGALPS